jgi:CelD/BcsL family acetyltransferase involved in cellulose biosynthesis
VRKELERSWRVFARDPAAAFQIVTDRNQALCVLSTMEIQQGARMQHLGLNFILNDETCAAFYRHLVGENLRSGYAVLSALTVGEEVVATLLGVRSGSRYVMVRISNAGEKWSNCSPGRLIIGRTMAALHRDGVRSFDFSVGNYAYKRRFGVAPFPLVDITAALSWRGIPYALRDRAVCELRRHPRLAAHVGRALGKRASREEI